MGCREGELGGGPGREEMKPSSQACRGTPGPSSSRSMLRWRRRAGCKHLFLALRLLSSSPLPPPHSGAWSRYISLSLPALPRSLYLFPLLKGQSLFVPSYLPSVAPLITASPPLAPPLSPSCPRLSDSPSQRTAGEAKERTHIALSRLVHSCVQPAVLSLPLSPFLSLSQPSFSLLITVSFS